jgi:hypothetical protein
MVVLLLGLSVWLALTNPTMQDYADFLERRLVAALERRPQGRSDLVGVLMAGQGRQMIEAVVRPNSSRRNYGVASLFETSLLGERVLVLRGVEEVTKKIEALGAKPSK